MFNPVVNIFFFLSCIPRVPFCHTPHTLKYADDPSKVVRNTTGFK